MLIGSLYMVELSEFSAEDLTAKDSSGTSDPFLKVYFGKHPVVTSPTIKANLNPIWKQFSTAFEYKVENTERMNKEYLRITCLDADFFTSEIIGECRVDLETLAAGPKKQELILHNSGGHKQGTLRFKVLMREIRDINIKISEVSLGLPFTSFTDQVDSSDSTYLRITYPSPSGKDEQVASAALRGGYEVPPVFNGIPDFVMRMDVSSLLSAKVTISVEKERKTGSSVFTDELSLYDLISFDASEQSYTREGRSKSGVVVPVSVRGVISNVPKFSQMDVGVNFDGVLKGARPIHFRARLPRDAKFDPPLDESKDGSRPSMPSRPSSPVATAPTSPSRASEVPVVESKSEEPVRVSTGTSSIVAAAAVATHSSEPVPRISAPSSTPMSTPLSTPMSPPMSPPLSPAIIAGVAVAAAVSPATYMFSHPETVPVEPVSRTSIPVVSPTAIEAGKTVAVATDVRSSHESVPPPSFSDDLSPPAYDEDDDFSPSAPAEPVMAPAHVAPVPVSKVSPASEPAKPKEERPVTKSGKKLPEGYEAKHDPKTGKTVYIDHFLKTTSWNPPRSLPEGFERATSGGKVFFVDHFTKKTQWDAPDPLPEGFERMHDKSKDKVFYVDHFLKATSWTAPKALPLGWERAVDGKGRVFYINHEKKLTQWEAPV